VLLALQFSPVVLHPQPSPRADNTEVIPVHNISSFEPSSVATLKEFQDANHGGVLNLHRPFSASPLELSSPPLPAITPPLSRNVQTRTSQDAGNIPFGPPKATEPGERDRSHSSQVDSLGEGNVMKPLAQQVDRTASVQPFPISSTHSVPPLNRRGISISSSISRAASVLTMIAPSRSRKGTARGEHPVEHPSELSHPRNEDKGKAYTNEQRPPSPRGHATATAESPSLPLPVFGPHLWDEIYPLIHGNEDVGREANGTAVGPTLDQERKLVTALDECATHAEDSDISYGARCRTAELSPSSDHTPDTVIPKRPPESLVGRMYSFNHSLRYDPNAPHLPETSEPREKLKRTPDSAPSLDRTESLITPPHPVLLPMQRQPNHAAPVPSNDELTGPNVYAPPQPPTVVSDSQARAALCPGPSVRSDRSLLEGKGETHPDTEIPLMQRPVPITTQPTPQECPSLHPSPRSSPLGDGQTEPEPPGQSGGDRKPEDRRTEDESIREAGRESPPLRKHGRQGGVKGRYLRAWKKYPCCCCIFHVLSFCYYLCSCGPCCD